MNKRLGALYLILGTCVAAGMLGLPIATAELHFAFTFINAAAAWLIMTVGALCLLQVNLLMPPGSNLLTMAEQTLGKTVKAVTWVIYLLLLYTLICAYLAASSDIMHAFSSALGLSLSRQLDTLLAALLVGGIVYQGIAAIDKVNRWLLSLKIAICLLLIAVVSPFGDISRLSSGHWQWQGSTLMVMITAFGYAIILPSIRDYLGGNRKHLKQVVWLGSFIPLVLYLVWIFIIQKAISRGGDSGLMAMAHSADTTSLLMQQLVQLTDFAAIKTLSVVFIALSSVTGLLGVSLSLVDFLADGLAVSKKAPQQRLMLLMLAYLPAVLIVLLKPEVFIAALVYAGVFCLYILVLLPIAMYLATLKKQALYRQ